MKFKNLAVGVISIGTALTLVACSGETNNEEENIDTPPETETETNPGAGETDPGVEELEEPETGTEPGLEPEDPASGTEPGMDPEDPTSGSELNPEDPQADPESELESEEPALEPDSGLDSEE